MNPYDAEYRKKLITPEKAVELIGSGDLVVVGMNNGEPPALLAALAARARGGDLKNLKVYVMHPTAHLANTIFAPDPATVSRSIPGSSEHLKGASSRSA